MANYNNLVVVNVTLGAQPAPRAGFGTTLLMVDEALGNGLNGDRTMRFASVAAAQTAQTAGYITAAVLDAVTTVMGQARRPVDVLVGRVDTVAVESYPDAYALILVDDPDFYAICIDSRADAVIVAMATLIEASTPNRILIVQSDDATWKTTGLPAGLTGLAGLERTAVVYHTSDAEWNDLGWAAYRMTYDPDAVSAAWNASVALVDALSPQPTDSEKGFLDANFANYGLLWGANPFWMNPGVNVSGRGIYELVTADWFADRLQAAVADLVASTSLRAAKIGVDAVGQASILALVDAQLAAGEAAGHFTPGLSSSAGETITAADIAARRIRVTGQATNVTNATNFQFDLYFDA